MLFVITVPNLWQSFLQCPHICAVKQN